MLRTMKRSLLRTLTAAQSVSRKRLAIRSLKGELLERRLLLTAVTSVDPLPFSQDAAASTNVTATFDAAINAGTATLGTFAVFGDRTGKLNSATVSTDGQTVTLDPTGDFYPGEIVSVTATGGIQDTGGNANVPRVWEFRTAVTTGSGQFVDNGQVLGTTNPHGLDIGDLDGDGDLDVLLSNYDENNAGQAQRTFLNDGNGIFTDSGQLFGSHNSRDVALGDLDGDGDLDYFSANYPSQENRVWFNDGSGGFVDSGQLIGRASSWDVELGDVDGDGDLDAYVGNGYAPNRLYFNDGSGQFTDSGQAMGPGSSQELKLGDLDGDGDLDVFVANFGGGDRAWLNQGDGVFVDTGQSLAFDQDTDVVLGDMDDDGDLDAVTSNTLWLNDGSAIFTNGGTTGTNGDPVAIGDLDGDGDLDLLTSNAGNTYISLNSGSGSFTATQTAANAGNIEVGDFDADGDLDFYLSRGNLPDSAWINQNLNPSVTLSVDTGTVAEAAGAATVTATLSAAHGQDVTIDLEFSGSATLTDDYTVSGTQIVIAAGATSGSIVVTAVNDSDDEPDETVIADIASITNGQAAGTQQVTFTILDDDLPIVPDVTLAVDNAAIDEAGGVATFTATLSEVTTATVTVELALSGSATGGVDYSASGTQIVIGVGATSGSVTVTAIDDEESDPDETVLVDIASVVGGAESGTQQQLTTITDDDVPPGFRVASLTATASGFVAEFNGDLDPGPLNLFDTQNAGLGAADATLVGATSGPITGSLVVDESQRSVSFIKSGGPLAADSYTVTLRSGSDAFQDAGGLPLDGSGDGTGGDYTGTFDVAEPDANAITVSLPDFTRGPGQSVNLPADTSDSIPISISEGSGVRAVDLRIAYDAARLSITGATVGAEMPAGATVIVNTNTPGLAILVFFSSTALPAGSNTVVNVQATIPTENAGDGYGTQQVLDVHAVTISDGNDNESPVLVDDAVHVVNYFGDVSGNGRINAADASQVARFAALIDAGFSGSLLADPIVVGDVSGNGRINAADASLVAQSAALIDVPVIPPIPGGIQLSGVPAVATLPGEVGGVQLAASRGGVLSSPGTDASEGNVDFQVIEVFSSDQTGTAGVDQQAFDAALTDDDETMLADLEDAIDALFE